MSETIIPPELRLELKEAARRVSVHLNTLHRWRLTGVRGVKLRCQRLGGRLYTTARWLDEFVAATNGEDAPAVQRDDVAERCRAAGV